MAWLIRELKEIDDSAVKKEKDPTIKEWAKEPTKPSYTAEEVGALPVTTKIPSKVSDLTNDSGYKTSPQIDDYVASNMDKLKGDDGRTPVKGVDYWTELDVQGLKNYIDSEILKGAD